MTYSDLERDALRALAERTLVDPEAPEDHVAAAMDRLTEAPISALIERMAPEERARWHELLRKLTPDQG